MFVVDGSAKVRGGLCVDEIDNGLHNSVLLDFWRAVADFVDKFNVQLIATTHHLEMLETLNRMVKEKSPRNGRIHTVDRR